MDEQRAEFEAWARSAGSHHYWVDLNRVAKYATGSWEAWQAATQRQQERIAELEADVAHKDTYAEQLGRELFKAYAERQELEAQVQALSLDAERLDWLTFHLSGKALRDIGVIWSEHADARAAIDAAIAAGKGEV